MLSKFKTGLKEAKDKAKEAIGKAEAVAQEVKQKVENKIAENKIAENKAPESSVEGLTEEEKEKKRKRDELEKVWKEILSSPLPSTFSKRRVPGQWKIIRIFISSTFIDTQSERDCLIKEVFPQINDNVKDCFVRVVPVDLRWGVISKDPAATIQQTCLDELDRCRACSDELPWFIGLRTARCGWVQDHGYADPRSFYQPQYLKWLYPLWKENKFHSITSMEVMHAYIGRESDFKGFLGIRAAAAAAGIEAAAAAAGIGASKLGIGSVVGECIHPPHTFFVYRNPSFMAEVPDDHKWIFDWELRSPEEKEQIPVSLQQQYTYKDTEKIHKKDFQDLDAQVKACRLPKAVFEYPCKYASSKITGETPTGKKFGVGYVKGLEQFRDFLVTKITESIRKEYLPPDLTEEAIQTAYHAQVADTLTTNFVGHKALLSRLQAFCFQNDEAEGKMIILSGESGIGKSALLAKLSETVRDQIDKENEEARKGKPGLRPGRMIFATHFIGASSDSEDVSKLLKRIGLEILVSANPLSPLRKLIRARDDYATTRTKFQSIILPLASQRAYLHHGITGAAKKLYSNLKAKAQRKSVVLPKDGGKVVILIDGLNNLNSKYKSFEMEWLPTKLPPNVRIIVSTLTGVAGLDGALKSRFTAATHISVPVMSLEDRQLLVSNYLQQYNKKLTSDDSDRFLGNQMAMLLSKHGATTPLYLIVASDALRRFGIYEKLSEYIRTLPDEIPTLFSHVLETLEENNGRDIVRIIVSLLAVSHPVGGLMENEMTNLLSDPEPVASLEIKEGNFARVYGPISTFFASSGAGSIRFSNPTLQANALERYHPKVIFYETLVTFFFKVIENQRKGVRQYNLQHAIETIAYFCCQAKKYNLIHEQLLGSMDYLVLRTQFNGVDSLISDVENVLRIEEGFDEKAKSDQQLLLSILKDILEHGLPDSTILAPAIYGRLIHTPSPSPWLANLLNRSNWKLFQTALVPTLTHGLQFDSKIAPDPSAEGGIDCWEPQYRRHSPSLLSWRSQGDDTQISFFPTVSIDRPNKGLYFKASEISQPHIHGGKILQVLEPVAPKGDDSAPGPWVARAIVWGSAGVTHLRLQYFESKDGEAAPIAPILGFWNPLVHQGEDILSVQYYHSIDLGETFFTRSRSRLVFRLHRKRADGVSVGSVVSAGVAGGVSAVFGKDVGMMLSSSISQEREAIPLNYIDDNKLKYTLSEGGEWKCQACEGKGRAFPLWIAEGKSVCDGCRIKGDTIILDLKEIGLPDAINEGSLVIPPKGRGSGPIFVIWGKATLGDPFIMLWEPMNLAQRIIVRAESHKNPITMVKVLDGNRFLVSVDSGASSPFLVWDLTKLNSEPVTLTTPPHTAISNIEGTVDLGSLTVRAVLFGRFIQDHNAGKQYESAQVECFWSVKLPIEKNDGPVNFVAVRSYSITTRLIGRGDEDPAVARSHNLDIKISQIYFHYDSGVVVTLGTYLRPDYDGIGGSGDLKGQSQTSSYLNIWRPNETSHEGNMFGVLLHEHGGENVLGCKYWLIDGDGYLLTWCRRKVIIWNLAAKSRFWEWRALNSCGITNVQAIIGTGATREAPISMLLLSNAEAKTIVFVDPNARLAIQADVKSAISVVSNKFAFKREQERAREFQYVKWFGMSAYPGISTTLAKVAEVASAAVGVIGLLKPAEKEAESWEIDPVR